MNAVQTVQYTRKPFLVDAVQVTAENMAAVSEWCRGPIRTNSSNVKYIKLDIVRPMNERQTQAFVGDWVLRARDAGGAFKSYTHQAFVNNFQQNAEVSV